MKRIDAGQALREGLKREEVRASLGEGEFFVRSAPGRLDVLGGLAADAGGTLAHMALATRIAVGVRLLTEPGLWVWRGAGVDAPERVEPPQRFADASALSQRPDFWAAPLAALWDAVRSRYPDAFSESHGLAVAMHSEVPAGAAQGATAAMLAAFLAALSDAARVPMDPNTQALLITRARAKTSGSHPSAAADSAAAVTDALTCLLAPPATLRGGAASGMILRYSTQPHQLVREVPVPPEGKVLALDTGIRQGRIRSTLEELHIAQIMALRLIETIYRDLGQPHTPLHGYLANTSPLLYRQYFRAPLPRRMRASDFVRTYGMPAQHSDAALFDAAEPGALFRVRTVADHMIAEHEHAEQFVQAMEELAGDGGGVTDAGERQRVLHRAGRLLLASHHSYRLRLELSCREADWVVDKLMEAGPERGVYGARISGTGGGGTVVVLVDRGGSGWGADALLDVVSGYQREMGRGLVVTEAGGAGGALQKGD